jgi:hypothetical protein
MEASVFVIGFWIDGVKRLVVGKRFGHAEGCPYRSPFDTAIFQMIVISHL